LIIGVLATVFSLTQPLASAPPDHSHPIEPSVIFSNEAPFTPPLAFSFPPPQTHPKRKGDPSTPWFFFPCDVVETYELFPVTFFPLIKGSPVLPGCLFLFDLPFSFPIHFVLFFFVLVLPATVFQIIQI